MDPSMIIAHFLDPARAVLTLAAIVLWRGHWPVLTAAAVSAAVCETVLVVASALQYWGDGIVSGFIGSLLQAIPLYWIVQALRGHALPLWPRRGRIPQAQID